jgi:hypothetical protein
MGPSEFSQEKVITPSSYLYRWLAPLLYPMLFKAISIHLCAHHNPSSYVPESKGQVSIKLNDSA